MSEYEIHPELHAGLDELAEWLRLNHLPMPFHYELSGNAPSVSSKVHSGVIRQAISAGAEFIVTNDDVCAVKDFGPLRCCFKCRRWDTRSVPPSDRVLAVKA